MNVLVTYFRQSAPGNFAGRTRIPICAWFRGKNEHGGKHRHVANLNAALTP